MACACMRSNVEYSGGNAIRLPLQPSTLSKNGHVHYRSRLKPYLVRVLPHLGVMRQNIPL